MAIKSCVVCGVEFEVSGKGSGGIVGCCPEHVREHHLGRLRVWRNANRSHLRAQHQELRAKHPDREAAQKRAKRAWKTCEAEGCSNRFQGRGKTCSPVCSKAMHKEHLRIRDANLSPEAVAKKVEATRRWIARNLDALSVTSKQRNEDAAKYRLMMKPPVAVDPDFEAAVASYTPKIVAATHPRSEYTKAWREANAEEQRPKKRAYYLANREKIIKQTRIRAAANLEEHRRRSNEASRKRWTENHDQKLKRQREARIRNRDQESATSRRRAEHAAKYREIMKGIPA